MADTPRRRGRRPPEIPLVRKTLAFEAPVWAELERRAARTNGQPAKIVPNLIKQWLGRPDGALPAAPPEAKKTDLEQAVAEIDKKVGRSLDKIEQFESALYDLTVHTASLKMTMNAESPVKLLENIAARLEAVEKLIETVHSGNRVINGKVEQIGERVGGIERRMAGSGGATPDASRTTGVQPPARRS